MHYKIKLAVLVIIAVVLVSPAILASEKQSVVQTVVFINSNPGTTVLGLVQFIVDEKNEPIDYIILHTRWEERRKVIWLEPGLYGITKYYPRLQIIVGYRNFWVKDKPITIEM